MKMRFIAMSAIALAWSFSAVSTAVAQSAAISAPIGHYEWRYVPPLGPKGLTTGPTRVWVEPKSTAGAQIASCNCAMMQHAAIDAAACSVTPAPHDRG